jgi:hypothetical protein
MYSVYILHTLERVKEKYEAVFQSMASGNGLSRNSYAENVSFCWKEGIAFRT